MADRMTEQLTLADVAAAPEVLAAPIVLRNGEPGVFRPLVNDDEGELAAFLESLSPATRRLCSYPGYDAATAREMCEAIGRYDKLRMVAVVGGRVVALFELSFAVTDEDRGRFHRYGIDLDAASDVRFGPCIRDDYQNLGLGSLLLPLMVSIARRFRKERMILWGGVLSDNQRAISYYKKHGFELLGEFRNSAGMLCLDGILSWR